MAKKPSLRTMRKLMGPPPLGIALRYAAVLRDWLDRVQQEVIRALDGWDSDRVIFSSQVPRADAADLVTQRLGPVELALEERLDPATLTPEIQKFAAKVNVRGKEEFRRVVGIATNEFGIDSQIAAFRDRNVGLVKSLAGKQLDDLRAVLVRAQIEAWKSEVLRAEIETRFNVAKSKADLLARDQTLKLNGQLTQTRQQNAGITSYRWLTSNDERVRSSHRALNGTIQSWASPPVVSEDGRTGHPGDDYQCRCVAFPVLEELDNPANAPQLLPPPAPEPTEVEDLTPVGAPLPSIELPPIQMADPVPTEAPALPVIETEAQRQARITAEIVKSVKEKSAAEAAKRAAARAAKAKAPDHTVPKAPLPPMATIPVAKEIPAPVVAPVPVPVIPAPVAKPAPVQVAPPARIKPVKIQDLAERELPKDTPPPGGVAKYRAEADRKISALPAEQVQAIKAFGAEYYGAIRMLERGASDSAILADLRAKWNRTGTGDRFKGTPEAHLEQAKKAVVNLQAAYQNAEKTEATVYRGLSRVSPEAFAQFLNSDEIKLDASSSSSRDPSVAIKYSKTDMGPTERNKEVLLVMKQKSGVAIETVAKYKKEAEILLPPGTRFRITDRVKVAGKEHSYIIYCEEL